MTYTDPMQMVEAEMRDRMAAKNADIEVLRERLAQTRWALGLMLAQYDSPESVAPNIAIFRARAELAKA